LAILARADRADNIGPLDYFRVVDARTNPVIVLFESVFFRGSWEEAEKLKEMRSGYFGTGIDLSIEPGIKPGIEPGIEPDIEPAIEIDIN
jgi:hypothetical protein